ncbi:DNA-binding transcriptional regulator, XRE-family HTH domain [Peptoniphilus asaccharolyticus DSM 20463]|uniref:DNA-binding transcriptional regulator, XRE-family HTH domain n=1 Tax=Peptoniphilus asaccharolyticus DSM 20463 TaxID=573058 RepID=A0A1W1V1S6_PEPAS|nr:helix-turn-helix transcriptional regulator [Peptoniphilus asaccharolyticus]MBL7575558.1 helix-turn-helix transcriptional regulator [Peptoniphilus asaccharolyticus]SMB87258.1 DNA-binding transcriptional regulator, XRE-family HTH domain [Peptoniphilus asaccharolyticus DSM 20463]
MSLQSIRESHKLSQQDMAKNLNIAVSTYCQYETGKRNIPKNTAEKIANILNVNINDIFLPIKFAISKSK